MIEILNMDIDLYLRFTSIFSLIYHCKIFSFRINLFEKLAILISIFRAAASITIIITFLYTRNDIGGQSKRKPTIFIQRSGVNLQSRIVSQDIQAVME